MPRPSVRRRRPRLVSAALFALFAPNFALGQPPPGLETWVDACHVADSDLLSLVESDAAMVAGGFVVPNLDGTYQLLDQPYAHVPFFGPESRFCSDSQFYGQARPDGFPAGRSAVLVGPDLVLTANHFISPEYPPLHDFVFGLKHYVSPWGACVPPDVDHIPSENVYRAVEIIAHGGDAEDFVLLRLDRPVEGRPWVRVRRSGAGSPGDRMAVVGHPDMLPTKVDLAASYQGTSDGSTLVDGAHILFGSSGSLIYNRDRQLLESVVRTWGCADYAFDEEAGCFRLASDCSDGPYALGHEVVDFADQVPAFELVVDSLADVVHVVPVGGTLPEPQRDYTITSPETAVAPIAYQVIPPGPSAEGVPELELDLQGPLAGNLSPGKTFAATTTASIAGVPCGSYERSFEVRDLTHGFVDVLRHRFEIGLTEVQVEPAIGLAASDLAAPWEDSADYLLTNPRPDPVTLTIAADRDWITLDGVAASAPGVPPSISRTLAPAGQPGDRVTVRVGLGGFAGDLPDAALSTGEVRFTNVSGSCQDLGSTARTVSFLKGEELFASDVEVEPIPDGRPHGMTRKIAVPENFCIGDVALQVRTTGQNAPDLTADLIAPDGTSIRIWDHHGLPATDLRRWFDDRAAPAPTGELLSTFDGASGGGSWTLHLVDDTPGGANQLVFWNLRLRATSATECGLERSAAAQR